MASKNIVYFNIGGGLDGVNFLSPTDTTSTTKIQAVRGGAPSNVLNYLAPALVTGTLTNGSNVITNVNTNSITGLVVGWKTYGALVSGGSDTSHLPATRQLTVSSFVASATVGTITLTAPNSASAIFTGTTGTYSFYVGKVATPGTPTNGDALYPIYEPTLSGRAPYLHFTQNFLSDKANVLNTVGNASKTKAAFVCNMGPLRKPLFLNGNGGLAVVSTRQSVNGALDVPTSLTSHNDQASTVQSNAPEGSIKGWGGGIADSFVGSLSSNNIPLAAVSAANFPPFTAGDTVRTFGIGSNGLIFKQPNFYGQFSRDSAVAQTDQDTLAGLIKSAALSPPAGNSLATSANASLILANSYQDILGVTSNITDPPVYQVNIAGSKDIGRAAIADPAGKLKTIARMLHANNPNRGATATRSGTTVTFTTEVGTGLANRTAGSTVITVTSVGHRLFTSGNSLTDFSDSVIVTGTSTSIDASSPTLGYKVTVDPLTPNDVFSFVGVDNATTVLTNVAVTFKLKHNLTIRNTVYIANTTETFDSVSPANGYPVTTIPSTTTFTVATTNSTAFVGGGANATGTMGLKFKVINLPNQVYYTESGMPNDSHSEANHSQLAGIDMLITYFDSLVSRMVDADVVTFSAAEFGRTFSTNSAGTDHGWGCNHFVFGKSVKSNAFYGDIMDYRDPTISGGNPALQSAGGQHVNSNMFMPTTSIYQYGATFAKWMGATDAQVLALFPDLQYWNISQWYLGFL